MTSRQQRALNNPLFSIFQIAGNTIYREDRMLPSGFFFSTSVTVDAFVEPFAWHAAAGFVRSINEKGNAPGEAVPVSQWDDQQKVLAMNQCANLLRGVGRSDGGEHWDRAEVGKISFQAWRRLSVEEMSAVTKHRADVAPANKLLPLRWEPQQRVIRRH